jgi:surfactin synthase thioesterase subunit
MHQNTFLTTPDAKKYLFQGHVSGGLKACEIALKHGSNHARRKTFFFLVVWKHAQMHQNAFLTTPDAKKHLF